MRSLLAIAKLTAQSAFRFRLIPWLLTLLIGLLIALPFLIRHNGTAEMFAQVIVTYSLSVTFFILGFSTLWLACGSLSQDLADRQIQIIAVKPVGRWKIWLGKWLGIMGVNAALLALCCGTVYGLLIWRGQSLAPEQREILREQILVARGAATESQVDLASDVDRMVEKRMEQLDASEVDPETLRARLEGAARARQELVPPDHMRVWQMDLGERTERLQGEPLQLKVKFHIARRFDASVYRAEWRVGNAQHPSLWRTNMALAANATHEFQIPADLFDREGRLRIEFRNRNPVSLLFPLNDGLELLFPAGGFGGNLLRAAGVLFGWLSVVAALGLSAAALLSFPVASFFALTLALLAAFSPMVSEIVLQGTLAGHTHDAAEAPQTSMDWIVIPAFTALSKTVKLFEGVSPIESLSAGRRIPWAALGSSALKTIGLLSGLLGAAGILILNRRELATAPQNA